MKTWIALVGVALVGCSAANRETGAGEENLVASRIELPTGDPCRAVLAPLATALADGAFGSVDSVSVSRVSETYVRDYVVQIERGASRVSYAVELDNDSHAMCRLNLVLPDAEAALANDARSPATEAELDANVPASVTPADDYCARVVTSLGRAAAIAAVGKDYVERVDAVADGASYSVHVDGKSFEADGTTYPNDVDYRFELDDECRVGHVGFDRVTPAR